MTRPVSGGAAVKRLSEVTEQIIALAEREEGIAATLRKKANTGEFPEVVKHRVYARADSLMRLAADLRGIVGVKGRRW